MKICKDCNKLVMSCNDLCTDCEKPDWFHKGYFFK